jgi:hypothetical protein
MADDAWKTTFEIRRKSSYAQDGDLGTGAIDLYEIINIHGGNVVGTYTDARYARKQARRKYKKLVQLVEKFFTS